MEIRKIMENLDRIKTRKSVTEDSKGIARSVKNIDDVLEVMSADEPSDIIADILHWADANNKDMNDLMRRGTVYYQNELDALGDDVSDHDTHANPGQIPD